MKKSSSSQSLNYHITLSAQFLQTKDLVIKFYDDCLTTHSSKEGCRENKSIFSVFFILFQIDINTLFHILLFLKEKYELCPEYLPCFNSALQ